MKRDLSDYRKSYEQGFLEEVNLPDTPLALFSEWFKEADSNNAIEEANAMTLTTVGTDGYPSARILLLKHFDENGFVFYSNYTSAKADAISHNNKVCISFFWPALERQVIIKGIANKISEQESQAYFKSRPRGSQLGAWVSKQSHVISSRDVLDQKLVDLEKAYHNKDIPKPDFWGGYRISAEVFEFWQGRPNRLHDRIRYRSILNQKLIENWKIERLSP